jgi:hypothetical protein
MVKIRTMRSKRPFRRAHDVVAKIVLVVGSLVKQIG